MPLMAVSLTESQVRNRTKTVTRRAGWRMLRVWRSAHLVPQGDGPPPWRAPGADRGRRGSLLPALLPHATMA